MLLENFGHGRAGDRVTQIRQGTLDSRVTSTRCFPGYANGEDGDLLHHGRPSRVVPSGTVVPLVGNQSSMPPENRVRCHDRGDLGQDPVSDGFSFRCQTTSLGVGQAKTSPAELLLQYLILFAEVLDHGILVAADPASGGNDEDLPWTNHPCHGQMMLASARRR